LGGNQIEEMLKKRIGAKEDKPLRTVDYRLDQPTKYTVVVASLG
jgi:hypothetical protein